MESEFRGHFVRTASWSVAGRVFDLIWPADADLLLDAPATLERFQQDEYLPYWAQPWPASILLAERILIGRPGEGRSAIELGCGVGLVSLAAAAAGWSVVASDYDADAIAFAQHNADRNGIELAGTALVDFREPLATPCFDAVFAADLTYERRNSEPLARWIAAALKEGGMALVSDPNRAVSDGFPDCARASGMSVSEETIHAGERMDLPVRGRIWTLTVRDQ